MISKTNFIFFVVCLLFVQAGVFAQAPDTLWTRTYGNPAPGYVEDCWEAVLTPDGGLALVGTYVIQGFSTNLYVMKIDSNGDSLWLKTYDNLTFGRAICTTPENGFIITGFISDSTNIPYVLKIDSLGNEIWARSYPQWGEGNLRSIHPVGNDGFILAGYSIRSGYYDTDVLLVRIDSAGDTLWSRGFGGVEMDMAWSARPTSDGGFIAAAWTESYGNGGSDFYIIKMDSNGDSLWTRIYGDVGNDETREILEIENEGYVFAGKTTGLSGGPHYYLMKIDQLGDSIWSKIYYSLDVDHRVIHSFMRPQNGGFELTGYTFQQDIDVLRTDDAGDSLWSLSFIDNTSIYFKSTSITQSPDGSVYLAGYNGQDIWVVKLDPEVTGIGDDIASLPDYITLHQNYPNPFNANTTILFTLSESQYINLSVYDLLGRKISVLADGYFDTGIHNMNFDAADLTSGVYFYNLKLGYISESKSMILLK